MTKIIDRTGDIATNKQGLTGEIINASHIRSGGGNVLWNFEIKETGEECQATYQNFKKGKWKSYEVPTIKDIGYSYRGASKSKFYKLWKSLINRCYNKNSTNYINFGAQGIKISNRWLHLKNFEKDIKTLKNYRENLENPEGFYLYRKNINENYNIENCIWERPSYIGEVRSNTKIIKTMEE